MGCKSLIKIALGLGLIRLKLGWIGYVKLSLNYKKIIKIDQIVITAHEQL
jgi:hypothetical protein